MWWDSDENLRSALSRELLQWLQQCELQPVVIGWGPSEIGVVQALAAHGAAIHASDWAVNMATYASFYVPALQQRAPVQPRRAAAAKHTVTFLLSDGDNLQVLCCCARTMASCVTPRLQWLIGGSFASPANDWWGSRSRSSVAMGWTVSPAMAELAPSILQRLYREASPSDVFVAGPSGVAYTFPDFSSNLSSFAESSLQYMRRADLSIVNLIALSDCDTECATPYVRAGAQAVFLYTYGYARCCDCCRAFYFVTTQPALVVPPPTLVLTPPFSSLHPLPSHPPSSRLYRDFYCGRGSRLTWISNVPVIGGRIALW
jgi:hypothetical protein